MTLFLLGLLLGVAVGALGSGAVARARLLSRLARPSIRPLGPYRTKLDVVQEPRKKVYCKECKHFLDRHDGPHLDDRCVLGEVAESPVIGVYRKTRNFVTNNSYDCEDWEAR